MPGLEELVAVAVEERRDQLQQLVRRAVDVELRRLVEEELAGRTNGNRERGPSLAVNGTRAAEHSAQQQPRLCRVCNERPAAQHRTVCSSCRERERRARRQAAAAAAGDGEEPHLAPTPEKGRRSEGRLASDRYWAERSRQLIQHARVTTEKIGGRTFVVRHLAPQFGAE